MKTCELELHQLVAKRFREEYYYTEAKYEITARSADEARIFIYGGVSNGPNYDS